MEFERHEIKSVKTVGEILKLARKKKNLSLEDAEEETKVRLKYLRALEEGTYEDLPATVYTAGFLAKYAEFLEIDKEPLLSRFGQERGLDPHLARIAPERKIKEPLFSVTPRLVTIMVIILIVAGIIGYIFYSVHQFTSPPNLMISSPSAEEIIKEDQVEIVGKTDEGVSLMINNQIVLTDDRGNFHQQVKLSPGLNSFEVRAVNQLKKENIKVIKVLAEYQLEKDQNGPKQ